MADSFDKISALPTAQKVAILLLAVALIGAGWYFVFYDETQTKIAAESGKTTNLTKELASEQEKEKNLAVHREEIEKLRVERDRMRDQLPEEAEVADLLDKIQGQAKITGLEMTRFERSKTEVEDLVARIPVKMELVGDFGQIATFFFYLGGLTRIVNVEDVKLTAIVRDPLQRTRANLLAAQCTATTFMYLPDGTASPGGKGKKGKGK